MHCRNLEELEPMPMSPQITTAASAISETKQERLRRLSGSNGVIGALAMDQRKSLRRLIATAAGVSLDQIPDSDLVAFKTAVSEVLSPYATAILLDTEYGLGAAGRRHPSCGLLLAYESDGYENPRPHRMPELMPDLSVQRLMESGADGVKLLLHFSQDDPHGANTRKFAIVERIGSECGAVGLPFFLEPLLYEPSQPLVQTGLSPQQRQEEAFAFARRKPQLVVDLMSEFSRERYGVDILKVEFPVVAAFVEGSATFGGRAAYSMDEALQWYRRADEAASKPYIYLSAGVSSAEFLESLRLANAAGAHFSGVLCGRAHWQQGAAVFAGGGVAAFTAWLQTQGVANMKAVNSALAHAIPWHSFVPAGQRG